MAGTSSLVERNQPFNRNIKGSILIPYNRLENFSRLLMRQKSNHLMNLRIAFQMLLSRGERSSSITSVSKSRAPKAVISKAVTPSANTWKKFFMIFKYFIKKHYKFHRFNRMISQIFWWNWFQETLQNKATLVDLS